ALGVQGAVVVMSREFEAVDVARPVETGAFVITVFDVGQVDLGADAAAGNFLLGFCRVEADACQQYGNDGGFHHEHDSTDRRTGADMAFRAPGNEVRMKYIEPCYGGPMRALILTVGLATALGVFYNVGRAAGP